MAGAGALTRMGCWTVSACCTLFGDGVFGVRLFVASAFFCCSNSGGLSKTSLEPAGWFSLAASLCLRRQCSSRSWFFRNFFWALVSFPSLGMVVSPKPETWRPGEWWLWLRRLLFLLGDLDLEEERDLVGDLPRFLPSLKDGGGSLQRCCQGSKKPPTSSS